MIFPTYLPYFYHIVSLNRQIFFLASFQTYNKLFGDNFVKFKDISFPGDFDKDLVHYSPSGMKKYFFRIRRIFLEFKCILDFHFLFV
jgi:hypothetical protein